jgi:hypothetical protein
MARRGKRIEEVGRKRKEKREKKNGGFP